MPGQNHDINHSDETLLQLYRSSNDNKWFGVLLQRYTLLLLGVAMKYLKNKSLAEDAVQHVFMKALTSLPKEEIHNFKGWLYILMRNHCLQELRNEKHHIEIEVVQIADEHDDIGNEMLNSISPKDIQEAIALLAEEQKQCVILFYLKKMSYQQITEITGYSYMQVKSYIQNGKRNLKQYLVSQMKKHD